MPIKNIPTYTVDCHPEPEKVYQWIKSNWYDLTDSIYAEYIDSINEFCNAVGIKNNFDSNPCLNGFSIHGPSEREVDLIITDEMLSGNCPFTGVYCDEIILDVVRNNRNSWTYGDIRVSVLNSLNSDILNLYSEESLKDHCINNEYYFFDNGEFSS